MPSAAQLLLHVQGFLICKQLMDQNFLSQSNVTESKSELKQTNFTASPSDMKSQERGGKED